MLKKEEKQLSKKSNYTATIAVAYRNHVVEHASSAKFRLVFFFTSNETLLFGPRRIEKLPQQHFHGGSYENLAHKIIHSTSAASYHGRPDAET